MVLSVIYYVLVYCFSCGVAQYCIAIDALEIVYTNHSVVQTNLLDIQQMGVHHPNINTPDSNSHRKPLSAINRDKYLMYTKLYKAYLKGQKSVVVSHRFGDLQYYKSLNAESPPVLRHGNHTVQNNGRNDSLQNTTLNMKHETEIKKISDSKLDPGVQSPGELSTASDSKGSVGDDSEQSVTAASEPFSTVTDDEWDQPLYEREVKFVGGSMRYTENESGVISWWEGSSTRVILPAYVPPEGLSSAYDRTAHSTNKTSSNNGLRKWNIPSITTRNLSSIGSPTFHDLHYMPRDNSSYTEPTTFKQKLSRSDKILKERVSTNPIDAPSQFFIDTKRHDKYLFQETTSTTTTTTSMLTQEVHAELGDEHERIPDTELLSTASTCSVAAECSGGEAEHTGNVTIFNSFNHSWSPRALSLLQPTPTSPAPPLIVYTNFDTVLTYIMDCNGRTLSGKRGALNFRSLIGKTNSINYVLL